jgi:O-succinylhomoserine sulfhydrylase
VFDTADQGRALFAGEEEGLVYSRYGNPNTDEFVEKLCRLEGCETGIATATGMSAVFTCLAGLLESGDRLVSSRSVFGSTFGVLNTWMPRFGIEVGWVDATDLDGWKEAIEGGAKLAFAETPSNPGLELIDIQAVADLCIAAGIPLVVDNCFATPYLQRPTEFGAHIVTHSATKFIDGQGRVLGGAILGPEEYLANIRAFARTSGPALSPFNAWILSKSLETLAVRMDRHCANALELARFLQNHRRVNWVKHPDLPTHPQHELAQRQMKSGGGLVTFEVEGGTPAGMGFLDRLELISRSSNLGDSRSIATHPPSTTHSKLSAEERARVGITDGTIRVSVGLEDIEDIVSDIDHALGGM